MPDDRKEEPKRRIQDDHRRINNDQRRDVREWIRKDESESPIPEITDYFREKPPKKEQD